jgi:hypothetical protein
MRPIKSSPTSPSSAATTRREGSQTQAAKAKGTAARIPTTVKQIIKAAVASRTNLKTIIEATSGRRDGRTGILDSNSCMISTELNRRIFKEISRKQIVKNMTDSLEKTCRELLKVQAKQLDNIRKPPRRSKPKYENSTNKKSESDNNRRNSILEATGMILIMI